MPAIQNTMRLVSLLAWQSLGGPPVKLTAKVTPIRKWAEVGTHFIAHTRRYCDEQGRCVEQLAAVKGGLPQNMCRFFGYGDVMLETGAGTPRDVEVQFPIPAHSPEEAYKLFDDSLARFILSMQAAVESERKKAEEARAK